MANVSEDSKDIELLYEYGERLNEAKDKSQCVEEYKGIIKAAKGSIKAKQLAAQLIPRFFKHFPTLSGLAIDEHIDLCEEEELKVRVQAIRGLPLFCQDTPGNVSKIVNILGQLLTAGENVERDAVHRALISLLRQDVKVSLVSLFKLIGSSDEPCPDELVREEVICFVRDKVFPLKAELLKPQEQMERHIADLVKKSLQDVTRAEFKMFMDFLRSLNLFGKNAPAERLHELLEIIEGQADLDAPFDVSDGDHIDRLISCLSAAIPLFMRGASNGKFLDYLNQNILPVFDKLPEEWKLNLLKSLAECSPYTTPQDSRKLLPSILQLIKKYMPREKVKEDMNLTYAECLLYTFHHLANRTPNLTNSLCGYSIVTGQPSDRLGEDFSNCYEDFTQRLSTVDVLSRATTKKLTQEMEDHNKAISSAKTNEAKDIIKEQKHITYTSLRTCNNILAMTLRLHKKTPSFIGDERILLSWKVKPSPTSSAAVGGKRIASIPSTNITKRSRRGGGIQSRLSTLH